MTVWDRERALDECGSRDEWEDEEPADTICSECGFEWWGNWTRGTLVDPPEPRNADCPNCNS